ncbi:MULTISPECIES: CocE/NonD family hydrolase [unclassified Halomonas]|uniref:CocE/NonD family hydrolase n=1 Tax=unclassified Halomonas TaxID=2609666 RepID=UPI001EF45F30|nr:MULTISPECIES: CocE/NonD family hydrolase [unclassified Halomonas]MCP1362075.1 CocE/NonD family hydrolase [Halomonas sp. BBD45]
MIKHDFPHAIREIEHLEIPLADGTRLAARIWLPEDADAQPVPAILEYLPYRKRDGTAVRDALTHPYFAGHGYACVRVDMRGNGESDGLMADEYLPLEQSDALEVIEWIAAQPWCDGNLGMMGISWGGFNSLQVAALRPEPLKAIITLCSTDDRYADDIHYKGGNLLNVNQGWASTMLSFSAGVPDPLLVGERWRELWKQRLEAMPLLAETWLSHPTRDDYWRHGSVCENYADIEAAVYCVGGWGDAYKNSVSRLMANLPGPKKAMVGPWIHKYPHFAIPNPAVGFLQEALRWWDYWLKGHDTGVMDEPLASFYLQDALPPKPMYCERPGVWARTEGWPSHQVETQLWSLSDDGLRSGQASLSVPHTVDSPLTAGVHQGEYCAIWFGPDLPADQRRDDAYALCFDSEPLKQTVSILGRPRLHLRLASSQDCGQLTVRLNDIAPDGQVAMITYGVRNLALSEDFAEHRPLTPGEPVDVALDLDMIGYRLPAGHRLRVSVSSANFPLVWPSRRRAALTLQPGSQTLELPTFIGEPVDCPFAPPESAAPADIEMLRKGMPKRTVCEDVASGIVTTTVENDLGAMRFRDHGLWVDQHCRESYTAHPEDPDATQVEMVWYYKAGRDEGEGRFAVSVESRYWFSGDADTFYIEAEQIAWEGSDEVHRQHWQTQVPRSAV